MKNLCLYYIAISLPIPVLIWGVIHDNPSLFFLLLLSYVLYRSFTDGKRLIEKKLIKKSEHWKAFIPFWTSMYIKELYFEK